MAEEFGGSCFADDDDDVDVEDESVDVDADRCMRVDLHVLLGFDEMVVV